LASRQFDKTLKRSNNLFSVSNHLHLHTFASDCVKFWSLWLEGRKTIISSTIGQGESNGLIFRLSQVSRYQGI
jgi:hypothetical protein